MRSKLFFVITLILVAALSRLLPHPPNFTPIAAIALFSGAMMMDRRLAFGVSLGAMVLSDAFLGFHSTMFAVYLALCITVCLGFLLRQERGFLRLCTLSVGSSVLFFVVTNMAVWIDGQLYDRTFSGWVSCFVAAIPFFHYTLLGDFVYVMVLFGAMAVAERWVFRRVSLRG